MRELGWYNDDQRQEVTAAEAWACPACASLSNEDKRTEHISLNKNCLRFLVTIMGARRIKN
eukprot:919797-Pelagomonas_calceolata.AAC.1